MSCFIWRQLLAKLLAPEFGKDLDFGFLQHRWSVTAATYLHQTATFVTNGKCNPRGGYRVTYRFLLSKYAAYPAH